MDLIMILQNFIPISILLTICICSARANPVHGTYESSVDLSEREQRSVDRNISYKGIGYDNRDCCKEYNHGCTYDNGELICDCWQGYAQNGRRCQECNCEDIRMDCKFVYGYKQCTCQSGYLEVNGKCYDCNCGPNSISCRLNVLKWKVCACKSGYVAKKYVMGGDDTCKECNCGSYGISCEFDSMGFRQCTCRSGSVLVKGFRGIGNQDCKECKCGLNSYSCKIDSYGNKECDCYYGFEMRAKDSECTYYGRKDTSISGWTIATIFISIVFSFMIIALLIRICSE